MSIAMTLSDLERQNAKGQFFQADLSIMLVPSDRATKFGMITHGGGKKFVSMG